NEVPTAPATRPSGISSTSSPVQKIRPCAASRRPPPTEEAKNAGSNSAPHGLSSARMPPMNAAISPMSIPLLLSQCVLDGLVEHIRGHSAQDRFAVEYERRRGEDAQVGAQLGVLADGLL